MFWKEGVLRNLAKFTGKHGSQNLFFNKEHLLWLLLNCWNNSIQEFVKSEYCLLLIIVDKKKKSCLSYLLILFLLMFTQPIKALQMFEKGDSSNQIDRMDVCYFLMLLPTNFTAKWELVFVLTQMFIDRGFTLKPTKKT